MPLEVKPMDVEEVKEVMEKPLRKFSRRISEDAVYLVHQYSGGHPYIVQTFGFYAFGEGASEIDSVLVGKVLPRVIARLSVQLFKDRFEATSQLERRVLSAMSQLNREAAPKEIAVAAGIPQGVPTIIKRLIEKDCIIKLQRGKYALFNPLFGEYVRGVVGPTPLRS